MHNHFIDNETERIEPLYDMDFLGPKEHFQLIRLDRYNKWEHDPEFKFKTHTKVKVVINSNPEEDGVIWKLDHNDCSKSFLLREYHFQHHEGSRDGESHFHFETSN